MAEMTRDEAIREACALISLVYHSRAKYRHSSDGFCSKSEAHQGAEWDYRNAGKALAYARRAVVRQLKRDGYAIARGFDEETGKEKA